MRKILLDLSIIIVNWNTCDLLRSCLNSIYTRTRGITFEVFVVDNGSRDRSSEMVRREFLQVNLIENQKNLGFARGNNQGFSSARGKYVLILNPDTEVVNNALFAMVQYLESNGDVGAVGGKFFYPDGSFQRYYNRLPTFCFVITRWFLPWRLASQLKSVRSYLMLDENFDQELEVEQPAGACIMVRKKLFLDDNFMDEQFPIYFGDVDLCRRIYDKGLKIFVLPTAKIIHHQAKGGLAQGNLPLFLSAEYFSSMIKYFSKHHGYLMAALLKILFSLAFMTRVLLLLAATITNAQTKNEFKYELRKLSLFLTQRDIFIRMSTRKQRGL